jgi:hypothetical protein
VGSFAHISSITPPALPGVASGFVRAPFHQHATRLPGHPPHRGPGFVRAIFHSGAVAAGCTRLQSVACGYITSRLPAAPRSWVRSRDLSTPARLQQVAGGYIRLHPVTPQAMTFRCRVRNCGPRPANIAARTHAKQWSAIADPTASRSIGPPVVRVPGAPSPSSQPASCASCSKIRGGGAGSAPYRPAIARRPALHRVPIDCASCTPPSVSDCLAPDQPLDSSRRARFRASYGARTFTSLSK